MKKYWDDISHPTWGKMDGKIGCAFSTSGGWGGGAELTCMSILIMMMNVGMLTFGVTDYTGHEFTLHYGAVTAGSPREDAEIEAGRRLGKRLAQWVAVYVAGNEDEHPGPMEGRGRANIAVIVCMLARVVTYPAGGADGALRDRLLESHPFGRQLVEVGRPDVGATLVI